MRKTPFKMPSEAELLAAHAQFGTDPALLALGNIVEWWDHLNPKLRDVILGAGGHLGDEPPCIKRAREMVDRRTLVQTTA